MGKTCEIGAYIFSIVWVLFPIRFPSYGILHHMRNTWVFPSVAHVLGKCNKTHCMGKTVKLVFILFLQYRAFFPIRFPSYSILHHMGNTWVFLSVAHVLGKYNKTHCMGKTVKLVFILFPQYGSFFPIRFPSYSTLHHMGNTWVSLSISHRLGKCNKTHHVEKIWKISIDTIPIVHIFL